MTLATFMKAAFGVVFGYDLDAVGKLLPHTSIFAFAESGGFEVAVFDEEHRRSGSLSTDHASLEDMDCFGYPQPYFSLTGQVPSRPLVAWSSRRSCV